MEKIATSKMRGPQCMGKNFTQVCDGDTVGSQLLVDRWYLDVECFGGGM